MDIIKPIIVSDAMLISSTIPEDDYAEYNAATTYGTGTTIMVTAAGVHSTYVSQIDGNLGLYPPDNCTGDTAPWQRSGSTNKWAMFDRGVGSASSAADLITVQIKPGAVVNSLALLNISAANIQVVMTDPVAGEVYNVTTSLSENSHIDNWYDWFFGEIIRRHDIVLLGSLPAYVDATVSITLSAPGEQVSCGVFSLGNKTHIGIPFNAINTGITDYSSKDADDYGNTDIVERGYAKLLDLELKMQDYRRDYISNLLAEYRATPIVWVGSEKYGSTIIYGFFGSFYLITSNGLYTICNLEIKGLT